MAAHQSFIVPNHLSMPIRMKDGISWPPLSSPAPPSHSAPGPPPSDKPPRAALRRLVTIKTGGPKWQPTTPLPGPFLGGRGISAQPILTHVFRNKLASLLKSLLWPMNIWCGQACGVEGYNDRVLSFLARPRGVGTWLDPEYSTCLLRSGRAQSKRSRKTSTHTFRSPKSLVIEGVVGQKPNWEQTDIQGTQWAFNQPKGPRSDTTLPYSL